MKEITGDNIALLSSVLIRNSIMKKQKSLRMLQKVVMSAHCQVHFSYLKEAVRAFQIITVNSTLASHHRISKGQWCH